MNIQYFLDHDEDGNPILKNIDIDITENKSIEELIIKLHEAIEVPLHKELKYDGEIIKVSCSHFIQSDPSGGFYSGIEDLSKKISEFPKYGVNGELSLFIERNEGLVN
ncbi:hypothetical protein [Aquimarina rubra]|uniref:Uncharacterized protein n=1 Tax=Aquimarina rubra TaxID=1920033 RepID=A0ABW5LNN9_9FLAO